MQLSGAWWYTKETAQGATTSATDDADMISLAFWKVVAKELKLTRSDKGDGFLLRTKDNCLDGQTFRAKITSYGNYQNGVVWGSESSKGGCQAEFGGDYLTTFGFAGANPAQCLNPTLAPLEHISFWNDWKGDGSVLMIGGGGDTCLRADHGIGVTEASEAAFGGYDYEIRDFGDDGKADPKPFAYSLNLFVR
jgi:hypothetical protein